MKMKLATLLALFPAAAIAAALAVANRQAVSVRLDPFSSADLALSVVMPLFLVIFASFAFGVVVGGMTIGLQRKGRERRQRQASQRIDSALILEAMRRKAPTQM